MVWASVITPSSVTTCSKVLLCLGMLLRLQQGWQEGKWWVFLIKDFIPHFFRWSSFGVVCTGLEAPSIFKISQSTSLSCFRRKLWGNWAPKSGDAEMGIILGVNERAMPSSRKPIITCFHSGAEAPWGNSKSGENDSICWELKAGWSALSSPSALVNGVFRFLILFQKPAKSVWP